MTGEISYAGCEKVTKLFVQSTRNERGQTLRKNKDKNASNEHTTKNTRNT